MTEIHICGGPGHPINDWLPPPPRHVDDMPAGARLECSTCSKIGVLGTDFKRYSVRSKHRAFRWRKQCNDCLNRKETK